MSKPTARQMKIIEAMRDGGKLLLWHGFNPYASMNGLGKSGIKVTTNDPFNLERKGIVKASERDWNFTEYILTEKWK